MIKWPLFFHASVPIETSYDSYLYHILLKAISGSANHSSLFYGIATFLLLYIQSLFINDIVNTQKLFPMPNHLTAMCYMLFTSVFSPWFVLSSVMIAVTFFIWVLSKLCKLQSVHDSNRTFYNLGMILGLSVLIYFPSVVFLLLIFLSMMITRAFRLPEWIIIILGILTPIYFLWAGLFLMKMDIGLLSPNLGVSLPVLKFTRYEWIALFVIFFTLIVGFVFVQNNMLKLLVQSRKSWTIIYLFLFFALILPFLNVKSGMHYFLPSMIPISMISAAAYYFPGKRWFPIVSHWSLFILSAIIGYYFIH